MDRITAITIVSAMVFGDEKKDQDRALWSPPCLTACVCDGVTMSPFAAEAAETVARFSPTLFQGNTTDRLRVVRDLLVTRRLEVLRHGVASTSDVPDSVRPMLEEVAREKLKQSFQTTIVAANFLAEGDRVSANVIRCGDSAFFAFGRDGTLLMSSPSVWPPPEEGSTTQCESASACATADMFVFRPGDELLAKVLHEGPERLDLLEAAGIRVPSAASWVVCAPLDRCGPVQQGLVPSGLDQRCMNLRRKDFLLVPKYLLEADPASRARGYVRFPYSRVIRCVASGHQRVAAPLFSGRGAATAVLPDHFDVGAWAHFQESFPGDGTFLLASDGLYSAFSDSFELWGWLSSNKAHLAKQQDSEQVLKDLHGRLHSKCGDDDISFVWVFPSDPAEGHLRNDTKP